MKKNKVIYSNKIDPKDFNMFLGLPLQSSGFSPSVQKCRCGNRFTGTDAMWLVPVCPDCSKNVSPAIQNSYPIQ